jgi:hypothetical protein
MSGSFSAFSRSCENSCRASCGSAAIAGIKSSGVVPLVWAQLSLDSRQHRRLTLELGKLHPEVVLADLPDELVFRRSASTNDEGHALSEDGGERPQAADHLGRFAALIGGAPANACIAPINGPSWSERATILLSPDTVTKPSTSTTSPRRS